MLVRIILLTVAFLSATSSAQAGWQFSKWGMSPEQVTAASQGKVIPAKGSQKHSAKDAKNLLDSSYQTDRFSFDVHFLFSTANKLTHVMLELKNPKDCNLLIGQLSNTYGPPPDASRTSLMEIRKWWDKKNGNVLALIKIGDLGCSLNYSEFSEPGSKGGL